MYGARLGGSGWVIWTSVPPAFCADTGATANAMAPSTSAGTKLMEKRRITHLLASPGEGCSQISG